MTPQARKYLATHRPADAAGKRAADLPEGVGIITKNAAGTVEADGARSFKFIASTGSVDREGDVVKQSGWVLSGYRSNPVVLLEHGSIPALRHLPIGRAKAVGVEGDALKATIEFEAADVPVIGPYAEMAVRLCRSGTLRAVSVGFRPLTWSVPKGEKARGDDWAPGVDFETSELMEISLVGIPANSEALITSRSASGTGRRPLAPKSPAKIVAPPKFDKLTPIPKGSPIPIHLRSAQDMLLERRILEDWLRANANKNLDVGDRIRIEFVQNKADELYRYEGWAR